MPPRDPDAFIVRDFEPAYLDETVRATLPARVERAHKELAACTACPRNCRINRLEDETKFCGIGRYARVSSAFAHSGEEDCLRGWAGSGTIFFTMCNLRCVFCQNWDISQQQAGRECNADALADLMLLLQHQGCHNINFVTPEHIVPQLVEALAAAIERGLRLPVVYNTSAYDSLESLTLMDGLVDIYMPDFKFWESESAKRLCKAKDYPERARDAIREMHRQVGDLRFTPDGLACRGLLVRHLVMPGQLDESTAIFRWLAEEISPHTFINIMGQYRPEHEVGRDERYEDINRRPTRDELAAARESARAAGLWRFDERMLR
jgi:putative pyruvate formate lyase activating enzyme